MGIDQMHPAKLKSFLAWAEWSFPIFCSQFSKWETLWIEGSGTLAKKELDFSNKSFQILLGT